MSLAADQGKAAPGRGRTIGLWVLRVLVAVLFLLTGLMKLSSQPMAIAEFNTIGLGQWFRYVTGALEVAGAIMTIVPRTSPFGALVLLAVDVGAFVAQVSVLHMDWIHPIVIGALLVALVYLQRDRLKSRG